MKPFEINTNSWHYKLVSRYYKSIHKTMPKNFCDYWRAVVAQLLHYAFIYAMGIVALLFILSIIMVFISAAILDPVGVGLNTLIVVSVAGLSFLISFLLVRRKKNRNKSENPKGLLAMKYTAWKANVCPSVEYK